MLVVLQRQPRLSNQADSPPAGPLLPRLVLSLLDLRLSSRTAGPRVLAGLWLRLLPAPPDSRLRRPCQHCCNSPPLTLHLPPMRVCGIAARLPCAAAASPQLAAAWQRAVPLPMAHGRLQAQQPHTGSRRPLTRRPAASPIAYLSPVAAQAPGEGAARLALGPPHARCRCNSFSSQAAIEGAARWRSCWFHHLKRRLKALRHWRSCWFHRRPCSAGARQRCGGTGVPCTT